MTSHDFSEFLTYTNSQAEVSLVLAKDEDEQNNFINTLKEQQFKQVISLSHLLAAIKAPTKIFYVITDDLPQGIYEFISQYPTGHLSIFDKTVGDFHTITPLYTDVAVVFIITKDRMKKLVQKESPILDKVGLVFQS